MSEPVGHRPVIWIVDDNATSAAITKRSLGTDYAFDYISDGTIAVERLTSMETHPDLLLLDWVMPGMTGDAVCRFLRTHERTKELPVIIVTGSRIETTDLVEGLASGANDYVARPFAPEELRARVKAALRTRELSEAARREGYRLAAVNRLAKVLLQANDTLAILTALADVLASSLCDGCGILVLPGELQETVVARHRFDPTGAVLAPITKVADPGVRAFASSVDAQQQLPPAYTGYIRRFGLRGLAILGLPKSSPVTGVVTLTRDLLSEPFENEDIAIIETCLEYAALAMQNAARFASERVGRQQLDVVLQSLPVGIIVSDALGTLRLANDSAEALIPGVRSAPDLDGIHGLASWRDADGTPIDQVEWKLRQARLPTTAEVVMRAADGRDRTLTVSAVPLRDPGGVITGRLSVIQDVSAERAVMVERERISRFQEELFAIVGHDLRNPLGALGMGTDMLHDALGDDPKLGSIVSRLRSSTHRMTEIVEQLLDVTHARLGNGIPLTLREVSLGETVRSVVGELALAHPKTRFVVRADDEARGICDPDRIAQVISNLTSNAVHYGASGGPITIELERAGTTTTIRVHNPIRDMPIPVELQDRLFDPFLRGRGKRNASGLGLGLYIVREIVQAHRGTIEVMSTADGTTFTVSLPNGEPAGP